MAGRLVGGRSQAVVVGPDKDDPHWETGPVCVPAST